MKVPKFKTELRVDCCGLRQSLKHPVFFTYCDFSLVAKDSTLVLATVENSLGNRTQLCYTKF